MLGEKKKTKLYWSHSVSVRGTISMFFFRVLMNIRAQILEYQRPNTNLPICTRSDLTSFETTTTTTTTTGKPILRNFSTREPPPIRAFKMTRNSCARQIRAKRNNIVILTTDPILFQFFPGGPRQFVRVRMAAVGHAYGYCYHIRRAHAPTVEQYVFKIIVESFRFRRLSSAN